MYKLRDPHKLQKIILMKMGTRRMGLVGCVFLVGALLQLQAVVAVDHNVGGDFGWNLPPNSTFFSEWARNKTFSVGDKLVFRSNANETHDVAEPQSQTDFEGCVKPGIVFSTSAVFSITFDRAGRRYFICTVGRHCNAGMKFSIHVLAQPGAGAPNSAVQPPTPPTPSSASSFTLAAFPALTGFLLTIAA